MNYDHPEHYRDNIEEYHSEHRHIPSIIIDLLLEQSGHRCTICREPNYDFHHIKHMKNGGKTEYNNLIVLCPNCHRRVHKENIPNPRQLKHYKLKLEISSSLPIIGRLTQEEKIFIKDLSKQKDINDLVLFNKKFSAEINHSDEDEAKKIFRKQIGYLYLERIGIISSNYGLSVLTDEDNTFVSIHITITPKGIEWINYLKKTKQITLLD